MNHSKVNWQRSSYCGAGGNNCLELSGDGGTVSLRESEEPEQIVTADQSAFRGLVTGIKAGRFQV